MSNPLVGFTALSVLGYMVLLMGAHSFIAHPSVSKKIMTLSHTSLISLCFAIISISLTYFLPHVDGSCICNGLWTTALIFYIISLYMLKFVYVQRTSILNQHPMFASPLISKWVKIITYSLITSCVICIAMVVALTDGECHSDLTMYGCIPTFHVADVWLAIAMIVFDSILFGIFCWKWWGLIKVFKLSYTSESELLVGMVRSFAIQFLLTIIAMLSCVFDGIINLSLQNYSALIMFCIDCAVIATCNFAMIKESQSFMWKYMCLPCRLTILFVAGPGAINVAVDSKTSKTVKTDDFVANPSSLDNGNTITRTITTVPSNTISSPPHPQIPTNISVQSEDDGGITQLGVNTSMHQEADPNIP